VGHAGELPWAARRSEMGRAHPWIVEGKKRIEQIDGIGCEPVLISATTEEVLEWIGEACRSEALGFPEKNGPIVWQNRSWQHVMSAELLGG